MTAYGSGRELGPIRADRLLRADLRRAREAAQMPQTDLADRVRWSLSKVQRVENGDVGVTPADVRALAVALGLGEAVIRELERRAVAARRRGWWHEHRSVLSPEVATLIGLEAEAERVREYALDLVPELMSTADYADAALRASSGLHLEEAETDALLRVLARRQEEFWSRDDTPQIVVVLDEGVLYHPVGGAAVMAAQVRRLAELCRRPQITIRVLPVQGVVDRRHGFVVVDDDATDFVVFAHLHGGDLIWEGGIRATMIANRFVELLRASLDADRTGQLLHRVAADYESGREPRPWLWA
ncbi:helix-turn-helix domain-containing protein [Actinoplanes sp. CA-054009]